MVTQITTYLRGWLGYFGDCQTPSVLQTLESWLRRRLRSVVWQHKIYRSIQAVGANLQSKMWRRERGDRVSYLPWGVRTNGRTLALSESCFTQP
jgi:hypothetical protein